VSQEDRLIVIGTLVRPHGLSRGGVSFFKIQFDVPGHATLPTQKEIWIEDGTSFRKLTLAEESSPLGGKWEQATGAKIALQESEISRLGKIQGRRLALPRESFAQLGEGELYLCDLLGAEVRDSDGKNYGRIQSAVPVSRDSWNLVARLSKPYEFPLKWVDWNASRFAPSERERFVVVPDVAMWVEVESLEGERDDD
jgi:ribosomal 30S subunit maturation factor RimM